MWQSFSQLSLHTLRTTTPLTLNFQITFRYIWVLQALPFILYSIITSKCSNHKSKARNHICHQTLSLNQKKNHYTLILPLNAMTKVYNMNLKYYSPNASLSDYFIQNRICFITSLDISFICYIQLILVIKTKTFHYIAFWKHP